MVVLWAIMFFARNFSDFGKILGQKMKNFKKFEFPNLFFSILGSFLGDEISSENREKNIIFSDFFMKSLIGGGSKNFKHFALKNQKK